MEKDAKQLIEFYENETAAFYKKLNGNRRLDNSFSKSDDIPLTEEEISAIDAYWGKYKFAYPNIDYSSFQAFKNRCGKFDVRHCPGAIRTSHFSKHFSDKNYAVPFQNKAMLQMLFPNIKHPRTIVRRMYGIYYDEQYRPISITKAVELCREYLLEKQGNRLIFKPNGSSGGHGIVFLDAESGTDANLQEVFEKSMGISAFVAQEVLKQSAFMAALNPASVNTVRITSLLYKKEVYILAALVRIGTMGSHVDNWCSGGSLLGLDVETGKCYSWVLRNDLERVSKMPTGLDLTAKELVLPNFEKLKKLVVDSHYRIPYMRMVSWDVALDEDNEPTLIECNFAGMIQIHEATTGPLFGELMDELLDEYLLKKFYLNFATEDFICREYHDHVVIEEYIGASGNVKVPDTLKEKPVKRIMPKAFDGCTIRSFTAPVSVMKNSKTAVAAAAKNSTVGNFLRHWK